MQLRFLIIGDQRHELVVPAGSRGSTSGSVGSASVALSASGSATAWRPRRKACTLRSTAIASG